ncbi:MAG: hypothetical protein PHU63_01630 [Candidatus ainarchaeum sp.]|nr:hypothetical protein [Candidatus ainarchaeum sp.]
MSKQKLAFNRPGNGKNRPQNLFQKGPYGCAKADRSGKQCSLKPDRCIFQKYKPAQDQCTCTRKN